jgi:hypothetical protein
MPDLAITDRRRRLVLDWTLVLAIAACIMAFADMRATVNAQTHAFEQLSQRLAEIEKRELTAPANTATKGDIARLEGRIDQLVALMMQGPK